MVLLFGNAHLHNKANRLIREQNEFQQAIYNEIPVGVSINDEHMNLIDCNPVFVKMLGVPKEKIVKNIFDFFPEYQPDGMKSIDKNPELFDQALRGQIPKVKWNYLLPDGKLLHCEITMKSIVLNGKPTVLVFAYNLSETKKLKSEVASLKEKIYEDPLTGINNRRYFDVRTNRILKLLAHAKGELSLLMLDIDKFKEYNDNYTHQMGDDCLKAVAQILSKSIDRDGDFVARYGGEEFVIVLPLANAERACLVAEKIIKNIREANIPHEYSSVANHVTLSIGVVTTGIVDGSLTVDDFVKVADGMLYASKETGRNRYIFREMGKE
jgi:diguanylate cyclase (GGDEF)-like protein/PAS domain S-box-containing protein